MLGFIPWIVASVEKPQAQVLSAWVCWTIISAAIALSRKFQDKDYALWAVWTLGDVTVLATAMFFGGDRWEFEKNFLLFSAGMASLTVSLAVGGRWPRVSETLGCLALSMGHVIMWQFYAKEPPVEMFFLLPAIAGLVAPVLGGIDEWLRSRRFTISTTVATLVGIGLLYFMAT